MEKRGQVLCVDDEPNILRSLGWLLKREFDVQTAPSGQDGLALVRANDFDVVISDQRMPGMMGSEFLREVSRVSPRSMRILLTGYSDLQATLRSVNESEVYRFINKPWNISELPQVVAEAAEIARTHPAPPPAADNPAADDEPLHDAAEIVLLIDDEATLADVLKLELGQGVQVVHATNVAEAIACLDQHVVGIILSDTTVGDTDVSAMLRMLKQQHPDIVSIVYTGNTDASDVIQLINQGQIFRFIPKPVNPRILGLAMRAAIRKRRQLVSNPEFAARHRVEALPQEVRQALAENVQRAVAAAPDSSAVGDASLVRRIGGAFRRLFGN